MPVLPPPIPPPQQTLSSFETESSSNNDIEEHILEDERDGLTKTTEDVPTTKISGSSNHTDSEASLSSDDGIDNGTVETSEHNLEYQPGGTTSEEWSCNKRQLCPPFSYRQDGGTVVFCLHTPRVKEGSIVKLFNVSSVSYI